MGLPFGHAPVYATHARTNLVAGADTDAIRRHDFADRWSLGHVHVYADYCEMLEHEQVDVVSIATPTPLHAEIAKHAVEAGVRAIFLEKPIASSLADADDVVLSCQRANVPLAVNHTRRGDPVYRKARQLIDEGVIGNLHSMVASFGGGLMWIGTHAFDLLNYFNSDRPVGWISGHLDDPSGFDPGGSAYVLYQNGVRAFINGSSGGAMPFRIEVIGSAGRIVVGNYDLELWRTNPDKSRPELLRYPFPMVLPAVSPMTLLVEELIDAMENGTPQVSDGVTATQALELIVGLHTSSLNGGCRVAFPITDRSMEILSH